MKASELGHLRIVSDVHSDPFALRASLLFIGVFVLLGVPRDRLARKTRSMTNGLFALIIIIKFRRLTLKTEKVNQHG